MNVFIFDLDGTLSLTEHRQHFVRGPAHRGVIPLPGHPDHDWKPDWDAFFRACVDDPPNQPVVDLFQSLSHVCNSLQNRQMWIFSERSEVVRPETEQWLARNGINYNRLMMRREGDYTPDHELKNAWLVNTDYPMIKIEMVFDDRDKVVKMWRDNGIPCCQVALGDF